MSTSTLKIKTKALPESRLAVELEIPAEECKSSFQEALSKLSKTANLPGFRKGKVPQSVILQQIGTKRIQASALEKLLEKAWNEALKQESIDALCEPELKDNYEDLLESFSTNSALIIKLETDVPPTPKLKATKGLTAEAETISFNPNKVDELIEQSRKQLATLIPVQGRSAKKEDIAVVSFKGVYQDDNSEIDGGSSDSMDVELNDGQMIPGFIEGIIGMEIGEEKVVECQFPKDYQQEKSKGRKANFTINLKELKARELPPLDDSFAKQASDKETIKELRTELEIRLKEDTERKNKNNRQEALIKALTDQLEIDLPKTLINQEIRNLIEQTARNFAQQGIDVKSTFTEDLVAKLMESSKPEAIANLHRQFALKALAEAENINISDEAIDSKYEEVKQDLSKEKNIDQKRLRQAVSDDLLHEKLLIWLEENNKITEKSPKEKEESNKKVGNPKETKSKTKKTPN